MNLSNKHWLILTWNYVHCAKELITKQYSYYQVIHYIYMWILLWGWTNNYTSENITLKSYLFNCCSQLIKFCRQLYTWCAIGVLHNPNVSKIIPKYLHSRIHKERTGKKRVRPTSKDLIYINIVIQNK